MAHTRQLLSLAVLLGFALQLQGCGGAEETSDDPATTAAPAGPETVVASSATITGLNVEMAKNAQTPIEAGIAAGLAVDKSKVTITKISKDGRRLAARMLGAHLFPITVDFQVKTADAAAVKTALTAVQAAPAGLADKIKEAIADAPDADFLDADTAADLKTAAEAMDVTGVTDAVDVDPDATTPKPATTTPQPTIVEIVQGSADHTVLVEALTAAGLVDTLAGTGPFTVFAPTDAAFTALLSDLGATKAELLVFPGLADILKYHVVSGKIMSTDLEATQSPATLQGQTMTVTIGVDGAKVNGDATVTGADLEASNGVVHVIDKVLMPPGSDEEEEEEEEAPVNGTRRLSFEFVTSDEPLLL